VHSLTLSVAITNFKYVAHLVGNYFSAIKPLATKTTPS